MIKETACLLLFFCRVLSAAEEQWVVTSHSMDVPFRSWQAEGAKAGTGVLVLVPGYNGDGEKMLDARWKEFAAKNSLVLLAPTFHAEGKENNEGKGYYYPEQGSGEVMEKALAEVKRRTGVATDQVLFFGFSAGAHYVHRFALWRPQRVKAFVAYSAGWWSEPTARLKNVPALVRMFHPDLHEHDPEKSGNFERLEARVIAESWTADSFLKNNRSNWRWNIFTGKWL